MLAEIPGSRAAVVIVSYNTRDDLRKCLQALLASGAKGGEVWIVDNTSTDGTQTMLAREFPEVHRIENLRNRFYAAATNQAFEASTADYYLLLNPDTEPDYAALRGLLKHFEDNPRLAAVAPQLRYPDGRIQPSCRRFPDAFTPWREVAGRLLSRPSQWKMADFDHRTSHTVDQPMFSCIWLSAAAVTEVGRLDEGYPLFFNDVDWCLRARRKGYEIVFDPQVSVIHGLGGTTQRYAPRRLWHSHRSFARYIRREERRTLRRLVGLTGVWTTFALRLPAVLPRLPRPVA